MDTITNKNGQLESVVGPVAVDAFRLRVMISAVRLEKSGMRASRGINATKLAQQTTGLKTKDRDALIKRLEEMLQQRVSECLVVTDGE